MDRHTQISAQSRRRDSGQIDVLDLMAHQLQTLAGLQAIPIKEIEKVGGRCESGDHAISPDRPADRLGLVDHAIRRPHQRRVQRGNDVQHVALPSRSWPINTLPLNHVAIPAVLEATGRQASKLASTQAGKRAGR